MGRAYKLESFAGRPHQLPRRPGPSISLCGDPKAAASILPIPLPRSGAETAPPLLPVSSPHHTTPHHTNPHPNPSSSAPPHHRRGRLLPSSQPPATPTPIAFASAPPRRARSVLPPPPTRPASSVGGRIWWLPRQARDLGLGGPLLPSSRASRERLRARVIVPRAPLFATVCLPSELSLPREGCRRSSVPRRITYRYAPPSNPCPLRSSPFPDLAAW
jgi:hypothetical protein